MTLVKFYVRAFESLYLGNATLERKVRSFRRHSIRWYEARMRDVSTVNGTGIKDKPTDFMAEILGSLPYWSKDRGQSWPVWYII